MKKARLVIAMVLVAMMTSVFSFASADAITVGVTADKTEVSVGDEVTVSFIAPEGLMALDMGATWDAEELELVSSKPGSAFQLAVPYGANNNQGAGAACTQLAFDPATAGATIFSVTFKVKDVNATVTGYVVEAVDATESVVPVEVATLQFTEYVEPTTTEAPTTEAPTTKAPEKTTVAEKETATDVETAVEVETKTETPKTNPSTGVVACTAAVVALAASGVVLVKSKRK